LKDEQRLSSVKKEFDALKVELGVVTNQYNSIRKELKEQYGVKNLKEVEKLIDDLEAKLAVSKKEKDRRFASIESKLQEYRR